MTVLLNSILYAMHMYYVYTLYAYTLYIVCTAYVGR